MNKLEEDLERHLIDNGDGCDSSCFYSVIEFIKQDRAKQLLIHSVPYNADHLWKKATAVTYALEKNGYLACLEDLEKAGIIELKNIDKNKMQ